MAKTAVKGKKTTRKSAAGKTLVVVESPTKAHTLSKILGSKYLVKASVGHIRDLPKSRMAIDIENNFQPEYILVKGKAKLKNELVKAASECDKVLLASDPDREGEAIAWHLSDILGVGQDSPSRIRIYEITSKAVKEAVRNPEPIDMDKVDAQQARRILDRLVGYTLSPLLWKKIRYGLSAGRVQSVALTLICDREKEIQAFVPSEYWVVTVKASAEDGREYSFRVESFEGKSLLKNGKPFLISSSQQAEKIASEISGTMALVKNFTTKNSRRNALPPFKTSTLQQEAARRLSFSPRRTMRVAQSLFEGVAVPGRGTTGLITYMRTDSLRLAPEAIAMARNYISGNFDGKYLPEKPNFFASKGRSQDAHEAIRPTDVTLTPDFLEDVLNKDQLKLYSLIWKRYVASQMAPAIVANSTIDAESGAYGLRQTGASLVFEGWSAVWPLDLKEDVLPMAEEGEEFKVDLVEKDQRFTKPPTRFSEARLIKTLEDKGVGRPSTYATIVETLYDRNYVEKDDDKRLMPTPLGMTVDGFLLQYFNRESLSAIVDVSFTARMEENLDDIEEAKQKWLDVIADFWGNFGKTMEVAEKAERVPLPPPEPIGEDCPECGEPLVKKRGRFGEFIACSGYPKCKYSRPILDKTGVKCPKCGDTEGGEVIKRKSKKGRRRTFYGCSRYPDCDFVSWDAPTGEKCPECGGPLFTKGRSKKPYCPECGYGKGKEQKNED